MAYTFNLGFASILGVQIVTPPTKTQYEEGETIDVTGMVVALAYSDGYLKVKNDYTYTPQTASLGDTEITVSVWTSRGFLTATTPITVGSETRLQVPEYIGDFYYFYGYGKWATTTNIWQGYDQSKMTIGGTVQASAVGTYVATFTPRSGYMWEDGTTDTKPSNWSIRTPTTDEMVQASYGTVITEIGQELRFDVGTDDLNYSVYTNGVPPYMAVTVNPYRNYNGTNFVMLAASITSPAYQTGSFQLVFNSQQTSSCPALRYKSVGITVDFSS